VMMLLVQFESCKEKISCFKEKKSEFWIRWKSFFDPIFIFECIFLLLLGIRVVLVVVLAGGNRYCNNDDDHSGDNAQNDPHFNISPPVSKIKC
jgi:hypothetical protein